MIVKLTDYRSGEQEISENDESIQKTDLTSPICVAERKTSRIERHMHLRHSHPAYYCVATGLEVEPRSRHVE